MMTKERFRLFMRFSRFENNKICYFVVFSITIFAIFKSVIHKYCYFV
nr:MAG TPA: hypothetical protein [Caudoviricetes sp.]